MKKGENECGSLSFSPFFVLRSYALREFGGPDGELGAALRYLSQRFSMVTPQAKAVLNDVGISLPEMLHFLQNGDKPLNDVILLHTISTRDRVAKWDGEVPDPASEFPYKITDCEIQRVIRLCVASDKIVDLSSEYFSSSFVC